MFEWFGGAAWQEWRATLTSIGALVALVVAGRTYALNSREKREKQARLIYSQLLSLRPLPEGSESIFPNEGGLFAAINQVGWRSGGPLESDAILAIVDVHNRSDEVVGPLSVRLSFAGQEWPDSPGLTVDTLHPESSVRVHLLGRNAVGVGTPVLLPSIAFRDSAGKWWKRKGTSPIQLLKQEPRLAGVARQNISEDFNIISLGNGIRSSHISSKLLLRFFYIAAHVPGLGSLVRKLDLREKAEARALRALIRRIPDDWPSD